MIRLTVSFGAAFCIGAFSTAWSQPVAPEPIIPELVPIVPAPRSATHAIVLKHIKPSLMAYWLDPQHNPPPFSVLSSLLAPYANPYTKPSVPAPGRFELPGTITQLVPVDPQNVLLVAGGSDDDIRRLREIVEVLDQPVREMELEVQAVRVRAQDVPYLGIGFSPTGGADQRVPLSFRIQAVRGNFQARLLELLGDDKAQLLTSTRRTISTDAVQLVIPRGKNQAADTASLTLSVATVGEFGGNAGLSIKAWSNRTSDLYRWFNSPSASRIAYSSDIEDSDDPKGIVPRIFPIRDGETIALLDFRASGSIFHLNEIVSNPAAIADDKQSKVVVFLTPRLIRRAPETPAAPGE